MFRILHQSNLIQCNMDNNKAIYTTNQVQQVREDLIDVIKNAIDDFYANSNVNDLIPYSSINITFKPIDTYERD